MIWVELLLAVLVEGNIQLFQFDSQMVMALRSTARRQFAQVMEYVAPHLMKEIVRTTAPSLVEGLPLMALMA